MGLPHITVCVCTYKRPELLARALQGICSQDTGGLFTVSVVVVDNDRMESAEPLVREICRDSRFPIRYFVEPRQNIALARNKAVANADGHLVAFIDDDEVPVAGWLVALFQTLCRTNADGVLGPVKPDFDKNAPRWVVDGGFYVRPAHPTGMVLKWSQCRTGNVLLKRDVFAADAEVFRPEFLSGEDQDFFKRKIAQNRVFVWCHEAPALEYVPATRWKRGFLIRRAMFRGIFSWRNRSSWLRPIAKSCVAASGYILILPMALLLGQAKFMACLFSLSYHIGRLLAVVGINPIKQPYVID